MYARDIYLCGMHLYDLWCMGNVFEPIKTEFSGRGFKNWGEMRAAMSSEREGYKALRDRVDEETSRLLQIEEGDAQRFIS